MADVTPFPAPQGGPETQAPDAPAAANRSKAPEGSGAKRLRDPRLDFYRGIAMFIILFAHTPGNFFTLWIPARWG